MDNLKNREPKNFLGAKPLLFDRLVDDQMNDPVDDPSQIYLSKSHVQQSIQTELHRLLNTRSSGIKAEEVLSKKNLFERMPYGLPSFYGMPDFSAFDPANANDWENIQMMMQKTIERYEPRLKNIHVKILEYVAEEQKLYVQINATLNIKKMVEEVTFEVKVDAQPQVQKTA